MDKVSNIDLFWSYFATFFKISASLLLLPFILKEMNPETVAIWFIFMTITAFSSLLDLGFTPAFTRNVSYVFSGVKFLNSKGVKSKDNNEAEIDFGLLKGLIATMRSFYFRVAISVLFLLLFFGTLYVFQILEDYDGSHGEVYVSWILVVLISSYSMYTLYYDSLLQGRGLIRCSKQILIIGQVIYIITAIIFVSNGWGLFALVSAQIFSVILVRYLSHRAFFTLEIKDKLLFATEYNPKRLFKIVSVNALKIGLTSLGAFIVLRSSMLIGSLFLPLADVASYSISVQVIGLVGGLGMSYFSTFQAAIANFRVNNKIAEIRTIYKRSQLLVFCIYVLGCYSLIYFGPFVLSFLGSQTVLLPTSMLVILSLILYLETNHSIAASIIMSKNEIPFLKPSVFSGLATIILLVVFFKCGNIGVWSMILAPGISQIFYQNWKWPMVVYYELNLSSKKVNQQK